VNPIDEHLSNQDQPTEAPVPTPVLPTQSSTPMYAAAATPAPVSAAPHTTNAGMIVLQWLTYALWGWTVLALSILTSIIMASFISSVDVGSSATYAIAAVLVLLPISFVCDFFYSKHESSHKVGIEIIVMVIHAVIFALFGIGSLIFGVFSIVMLLTSSSDSSGSMVSLTCSAIIAVYYGLTFLRTLNPAKLSWVKKQYKYLMLASVSVIIVLGITGPIAKERSLRNDKLIVNELGTVSAGVNDYYKAKNKLPSNLQQLDIDGDAKRLVDLNLVTYTAGKAVKPTSTDTYDYGTGTTSIYGYTLCVSYKEKTHNYSSSNKNYDVDDEGYTTYLSLYDHPAGKTCYKLKTSNY
jgi:hypothetical protein